MYYATIPLWIFSAVVLFSSRKNKTNIWLSAAAFFAGLGGVSVFLLEYIIPYISVYFSGKTPLLYLFNIIICFFSLGCLLLYPYFTLVFCTYYSEVFSSKYVLLKRALRLGFLIPITFILAITPFTYYTSPDTVPPLINFIITWALICFLLANFLLIYSYFNSKTSIEKNQRLLVFLLVTPSTLASFCTTYASHWIGLTMWRYNDEIALFVLLVYSIFAFRYGMLGLKLKIELKQLDHRIKTSFSGMSSLNHAIKNELQNISICSQMLRNASLEVDNTELSNRLCDKLDIIQSSMDRILSITSTINEQTKDFVINETECNLSELVNYAIENIKAQIYNRDIIVANNINLNISILCDRTHIQEVLINILRNSIAAIKEHGEIEINTYRFRKYISLVVKDNGAGISAENLKHVLEPFFSTKNNQLSFGIGLTYCFNVMRKHGGSLEINSEEYKGTSVTLNFSPKKIVSITEALPASMQFVQ